MQRAKIALAVALTLTVIAIAAVLSSSPLTLAGASPVTSDAVVELDDHDASASTCQAAGTIPAGTTAIRAALEVRAVGPRVSVEVFSRSTLVTEGELSAGWGVATSATVPVKRVARTISDARICTTVGPTVEPFRVRGTLAQPGISEVHALQEVDLGIEYLRPAARSWWSLASSVAFHMGLGRAPSGSLVAWLVLALMLVVVVLASRLALRELATGGQSAAAPASGPAMPGPPSLRLRARALPARLPRAAWMCALIACMNAACWSLITPPFQVPDEESHFAYTQHVVETGQLPASYESTFSPEERAVLIALNHQEVRGSPETRTISTTGQQRQLQDALDQHLSRAGRGVAGAANDPPLYYLLQAVPYSLASAGTLLDQLELMRLASALMAGLTALFAYLFVRETLPGVRWAWTVGGLAVALAPLLGFMSGAVNPDSMLFAVSAAICYCLARAFRRGLTRGLAVTIGALTAVGLLTNLNFIGLAPGVVLGLIVLAVRATRVLGRRTAVLWLVLAIAIAASPAYVYALANVLSNRPTLGVVSESLESGGGLSSLLTKLSYIWQLYLPRLPGTASYFPGLFTARELWFDRFVGFYGWLDTTFAPWVETVALIPAGLILVLCIRGLAAARASLRERLGELVVYAAMAVGLMVLIGAGAYFRMGSEGLSFAEPRYLAPMLPLLALALALAARGAGRRWGPAVGAVIVVLFLAHDIFSQLLVVGRYYG